MPRAYSLPINLTDIQRNRFWSNVSGYGSDGCWLWSGRVDNFGYGHFKVSGHSLKAHRIAFTLQRGPIPQGMILDHVCRTPACVNPGHLQLVTNRENIMRGESPAALNGRKSFCAHGHELTEDNTYRYSNAYGDHRACRVCISLREQVR